MVAIRLVDPLAPVAGWPARTVGAALSVAGAALAANGSALFARVGTNIKTFDDPDALVVSGPFAWSRNPMYLGFVLLLLGAAGLLAAPFALVGPVAFVAAAQAWYIPFEEQRMVETFGDSYDGYRRRVRRWFGRTTVRREVANRA